DLSHLDPERVRARFPRIVATCRRYGVDPTRDRVPVTPAAHYVMGGVATDLHARSTLPGLYAAGEAAGTGVHGANRLASNSLLDVAWAMAASALFREESRGSHYRLDFPRPDDRFRGHTLLEGGAPHLVDVETPIPEGARC